MAAFFYLKYSKTSIIVIYYYNLNYQLLIYLLNY